ncbi:MAG: sigma-70 family RNA polymerase sigma factor [Candidatus Rokuibacteriota bacterium]
MTRPHLDALYRFAVRSVRSTTIAEDLVQETCLKAYCASAQFERGTDYRAWLFRILANTILDWHRGRFRRPIEVLLDEVRPIEMAGSDVTAWNPLDPETQATVNATVAAVGAALDALPEVWRCVVYLSFVEGLSYKEIADILGCPVGTVMSRLYRAGRALRRCLSPVLDGAAGCANETVG